MPTCNEYAALKSAAEASLLIAESDRDVAAAEVDVAEVSLAVAMDEVATANIVLSQKENAVINLQATIMGITMMMYNQNC